ncbi:MAG: hypothetical protein MZV49_04435 [Rhodopseudomonas palustris]|nr:hypothetical protein [Rhodopseudomonas palustris]
MTGAEVRMSPGPASSRDGLCDAARWRRSHGGAGTRIWSTHKRFLRGEIPSPRRPEIRTGHPTSSIDEHLAEVRAHRQAACRYPMVGKTSNRNLDED